MNQKKELKELSDVYAFIYLVTKLGTEIDYHITKDESAKEKIIQLFYNEDKNLLFNNLKDYFITFSDKFNAYDCIGSNLIKYLYKILFESNIYPDLKILENQDICYELLIDILYKTNIDQIKLNLKVFSIYEYLLHGQDKYTIMQLYKTFISIIEYNEGQYSKLVYLNLLDAQINLLIDLN
jgi:hypothetical protein